MCRKYRRKLWVLMYNTWWPKAVLALLLTCASLEQKRQTLSPSWQWEIPGITSQRPNHNPRGAQGKENPRKVRWLQNPGIGALGCKQWWGRRGKRMSIISMIDAGVPAEHGEIIAVKWHGWDTARECCAVEMEMNAKYVRESSCVYCSAFRKAPGSLALQSVDVINRKTLCFWG